MHILVTQAALPGLKQVFKVCYYNHQTKVLDTINPPSQIN